MMTKVNIQRGLTQRLAAMISFGMMAMIVAVSARAHTPHDMVLALGVSPDYGNDKTLYVATEGALTGWRYPDILRSTDGGKTWGNVPNGMDAPFQFSVIRVSPNFSSDHTVFAATRGGGVYQSLNRGDSWQLFNTGLSGSSLTVKKMEVAGLGGTDYVLFVASGNSIYRRASTQTGWVKVRSKFSPATIAVSPDFAQDGTVMAADTTGKLLRSTDGGLSWTDMGNSTGSIVYAMAIAPGAAAPDTQEIFLATSNGIFYSNDSGVTFVNKPANLPAEAINNVAVSPNYLIDRTVFCTSITKAVFKSTNRGDSWTFFESGAEITKQTTALNEFSEIQISKTYVADQTLFLSAYDGLFISANGGVKWSEKQIRKGLLTGLALSPHFENDQRVIATTYVGPGVYVSADSGVTWSAGTWPNRTKMNIFDAQFARNPSGSPTAIAATVGQVGFSSDFGATWSPKFIPKFLNIAKGAVEPTTLAVSPTFHSDKEVYIGSRFHGVLQMVDNGKNWRTLRGVPTSTQITSVAVSPNYAIDRIAFAANAAGEVWRTADGGSTFSQVGSSSIVSRGWPGQRYNWVAISPDFAADQLVLVGTNNGIYRSGNGGIDWEPLIDANLGAPNVIYQIEFSPNFSTNRIIYVNVRGKGLYRVQLVNNNGWEVASTQSAGLIGNNIQFTEFGISPNFAQDTTLLAAARKRVHISTNRGVSWVLGGVLPGL